MDYEDIFNTILIMILATVIYIILRFLNLLATKSIIKMYAKRGEDRKEMEHADRGIINGYFTMFYLTVIAFGIWYLLKCFGIVSIE